MRATSSKHLFQAIVDPRFLAGHSVISVDVDMLSFYDYLADPFQTVHICLELGLAHLQRIACEEGVV